MNRRIATWWAGYEPDGSLPSPVRRWQDAVHRSHRYDLEVDTSQTSPMECASLISKRLANGPPATAFSELAGSVAQD